MTRNGRRRLSGLPRPVYWTIGAVIALAGALTARFVADAAPAAYRVPIWLTGAAVIFIGLGVLSLGTRARQDEAPPPPRE